VERWNRCEKLLSFVETVLGVYCWCTVGPDAQSFTILRSDPRPCLLGREFRGI